ncbi:MAG: hypothetical protein IPM83_05460 [Ignavibacteria bacterium]|nr:hypothetical protein [Ignavibacteria bacterium]
MQIRTQLMHAWATAVETVGTFTGNSLKSGEGPSQDLDFFKIAGDAIASLESTNILHFSKADTDLLNTVVEQYNALGIKEKWKAYQQVIQSIPGSTGKQNKSTSSLFWI